MSTERPECSRRSLAAKQLDVATAALTVAAKLVADDPDARNEYGMIRAAMVLVDDVRESLRDPDWVEAATPAVGVTAAGVTATKGDWAGDAETHDIGDPGA